MLCGLNYGIYQIVHLLHVLFIIIIITRSSLLLPKIKLTTSLKPVLDNRYHSPFIVLPAFPTHWSALVLDMIEIVTHLILTLKVLLS